MAFLTNDELIKHRSRAFRGYRMPMAISEFEGRERIVSTTRDAGGNIEEIVEEIVHVDGTRVVKTTSFTIVDGDIVSSTVTYTYEDQ